MPRRREGTIRESLSELVELARRCEGGTRARVGMLLALKRDPSRRFAEIAAELRYSERHVHRWWAEYRRDGIARLMRGAVTPAPRTAGIAALLAPSTVPGPGEEMQGDVSPRVARFLNAMPTSSRSDEWMRRFHAALKGLLGGVDMITLRVNLGSDIDEPDDDEEEPAELVIVDEAGAGGSASHRRRMRAQSVRTTPGRALVAQILAEGFPGALYQIPTVFDYFIEGGEYVGSIVLWRERSKTPVPSQTIELLRSLDRFIAFALSDCVSRHVKRDPELHHFRHIIDTIAARIGLRGRELEIFALQLAGADRREIAARQGIALSTVGKYVASIHAKAGTRNYTELLTRFAAAESS